MLKYIHYIYIYKNLYSICLFSNKWNTVTLAYISFTMKLLGNEIELQPVNQSDGL